jgi:peptidoglycan/xylan/chitin deacetylase (PgdA/CDA1 family)
MQSVDGEHIISHFSYFRIPANSKLIRINTKTGAPANPTDVSRGIYGATVGVDRLLKLWDKFGIKTTWFVPAHSLESFPEQLAKVRDAGHEM